ncbi:MAG: LysR substrate-binding domain-containing protein [Hyphomicrobiaceae bacterium]|nr:LysR substrate-binding domain-containing protein [Hyphomicrobiaceae bacterium]
MDIRQLKCFDAVLTTGAMTRAAELLGLAQPTVSITIAQLEREIGFELFERSKGRLEPTPEAYSFHEAARLVLESVSRVTQTADEIKRLNEGEISILCYPGIAWRVMPELIEKFRRGRKGVQIKLVSRSSAALRQLILTQNFDIAVVEAPVAQSIGEALPFRYRCHCALPHNHPLAEKDTLTPNDLDGEAFVTLFPEHATHHQIRNAFAAYGAELRIALECDFFVSALRYVSCGSGVTVVDPITASHIETSDVVLRRFEPAINYELALVRPTNRPRSRLADAFCEDLAAKLQALTGNDAQARVRTG